MKEGHCGNEDCEDAEGCYCPCHHCESAILMLAAIDRYDMRDDG